MTTFTVAPSSGVPYADALLPVPIKGLSGENKNRGQPSNNVMPGIRFGRNP